MYEARNNNNEKLWIISDRRVNRLYDEYTSQGFIVMVNKRNHIGPDLIVISTIEGKVVKIIESTNYARFTREGKPEYISTDKMLRYIRTLNFFDRIVGIRKELVVSFKENLAPVWYKKLTQNNIKLVIEGKQD